jgi:hypothetical protein
MSTSSIYSVFFKFYLATARYFCCWSRFSREFSTTELVYCSDNVLNRNRGNSCIHISILDIEKNHSQMRWAM